MTIHRQRKSNLILSTENNGACLDMRLNDGVLQGEQATYGKQVIPSSLAEEQVQEYGRSFEAKNQQIMMKFAEIFCGSIIVVPLVRQSSWPHFVVPIPLGTQDTRLFYAE